MSVGNELNTDKNEDWLNTADDGLNNDDDVYKFGNRDSNICGILEVNILEDTDAGDGGPGGGSVTVVFVRPFISVYIVAKIVNIF